MNVGSYVKERIRRKRRKGWSYAFLSRKFQLDREIIKEICRSVDDDHYWRKKQGG